MHDMNKKQNEKNKNPTMKELTYRISGKGKSWSYEYGKLYPGRYNTPPLQEDLVPRSRMAPERNGRGREEVKQELEKKHIIESTREEERNDENDENRNLTESDRL